MKKILLTSFILLGILTGCSTTQSTQYYQLPDSGVTKTTSNPNAIFVKVNLVSFLETSSMAYQVDDVTLNFSQQNLWAQTLKEGISQSLTNKLNQNQYTLFALPDNKDYTGRKTVTITINRFYGRFDGQVAVNGFFQLRNQQQQIIKTQTFDYLIYQQGDGYAAMVKALDQGLDKVAKDILYNL